MNNDIYRLVNVNGGQADTANIAQVFSRISSGGLKLDLQLLNYYHEVPVSYAASIISVENDSVELKVHEHQAVVMKMDKSTLIKSKHFHNELGVHCYASYVNVQKKTVILQNFAYAQIRAERREAVRVGVSGTIEASFTYQDGAIEGGVVDISGNGISFNTAAVPQLNPDQAGDLNFTITGTAMVVPGSFVKSTSKGSDGNICVFQMKPSRTNDNIIAKYIYQRQVEIIQELKDGFGME